MGAGAGAGAGAGGQVSETADHEPSVHIVVKVSELWSQL